MAPGCWSVLSRLNYIFLTSPHHVSTCYASLALNQTFSARHIPQQVLPGNEASAIQIMRSIFVSLISLLLLRGDGHAAAAAAGQGSSSVYNTRFENVTWDNANWIVQTTNLDQGHYQSRASVANGYLGINVAAAGPFFEQDTPVAGDNINGWPLFGQRQTFATIAGLFDQQATTNGTNFPWLNQYGGESVISGVPHWSALILDLGDGVYLGANVDNSTISNFSSSLNAQKGVLSWSYTWAPARSNATFDIAYSMFAHKLYVNQAFVQLNITPSQNVDARIVNVLDGTSAVRTDFVKSGETEKGIYTAVSPINVDVEAYIYTEMQATEEVDASSLTLVTNQAYIGANDSSIAQGASAALRAGKTTVITKYVGAASTDGFVDPQKTAQGACQLAAQNGFARSLQTHEVEWAEVFPPDSVDSYAFPENDTLPADEYIIESAITAVLNPYYLLQNTVSANALSNASFAPIDIWSISVGGLTSDSYAGMIFWDAEVWMQPGLAVSHPQAVKQIANYRAEHYDQAKKNAQTAYQSSKNKTTFSDQTAVFPWTSGRAGNCTGTGPCWDYEYHINGDIAQMMVNYWVTSGDTEYFNETLFPIYDSIAQLYSQVVTKNGSSYTLTNMTDPDEYANMVDNGGFTMPLIADTLMNANLFREFFGQQSNSTFDDVASNIYIDKNSEVGIINEYTGMNGSISVKQADVVLVTFPLNYQQNYTNDNARADLDYYAGQQSLEGPGMTYAIFSIVASEVDTAGCSAYTYQQYSEQPYSRAPWFQFSEQLTDNFEENGGTHPAYPFLTGHGGANQVTVFGYLGLRLSPDFTLHIAPSLPPQIPYLRYRTIYFHGWPISAFSNQTHTVLTRLANSLGIANSTFANTPISVSVSNASGSEDAYDLSPNGTVTVANRLTSQNKTVSNNIAQCQPISSPDDFLPGQFPISANDGASSTKWEPRTANVTSTLTLNLNTVPIQPITGFFFDWAQVVPVSFAVYFHNDTLPTGFSGQANGVTNVASQDMVQVDKPYDEAVVNVIRKYTSNTTNVELDSPVYSGRFATLQIKGNQADPAENATGATVAEWAIIGQGSA